MTKKTKTFRFYIVMTTLVGLNLLILGKALAQNQVASLAIQPGNLTLAVPTSISFQRIVQLPGTSVKETKVLPPTSELQNIEVIDPSTGNQFHVNITMQNLSASGLSASEQSTSGQSVNSDPTQPVGPFNISNPIEIIDVANANAYYPNDTIIVNNTSGGPSEHMRVIERIPTTEEMPTQIRVKRGVDNTETLAVPIAPGTGFNTNHLVGLNQFGFLVLHANGSSDSVDTSTMNNPPGANNVTSNPIDTANPSMTHNYYYDPANNPVTGYADENFLSFPPEPGDPDPSSATSASMPVTIMERTTDTPSVGIYSVGLALRANMPPDGPSGNFTGELTFSLEP